MEYTAGSIACQDGLHCEARLSDTLEPLSIFPARQFAHALRTAIFSFMKSAVVHHGLSAGVARRERGATVSFMTTSVSATITTIMSASITGSEPIHVSPSISAATVNRLTRECCMRLQLRSETSRIGAASLRQGSLMLLAHQLTDPLRMRPASARPECDRCTPASTPCQPARSSLSPECN